MIRSRLRRATVIVAGFAMFLVLAFASASASSGPGSPDTMSPRERALHALNRLGFGPRPGDVDRVVAMGASRWIAAQLEPEKIPDPIASARTAELAPLMMSQSGIFEQFEKPL